jgi:hypothetical protein
MAACGLGARWAVGTSRAAGSAAGSVGRTPRGGTGTGTCSGWVERSSRTRARKLGLAGHGHVLVRARLAKCEAAVAASGPRHTVGCNTRRRKRVHRLAARGPGAERKLVNKNVGNGENAEEAGEEEKEGAEEGEEEGAEEEKEEGSLDARIWSLALPAVGGAWHIACTVIECHETQDTSDQNAVRDVASNI